MNLTKEIIKVSSKYQTPFLLVDPEIIKENYRKIKTSFQGVEVYYAIKANFDLRILKTLKDMGCGFEIASIGELKPLLKLKVNPSLIISSNPVKTPDFIKMAFKNKIKRFSFDSKVEIDKIVRFAPKSKVYARLEVSNIGSEWPLTKKFGLDLDSVIPLLKYAKKKKLDPYGLMFHVGSQCLNKFNWTKALKKCHYIFELAAKEKIHFKKINLGGGLPVKHTHETPTIEEIGQEVNKTIKKLFPKDVRIFIEPGRAMVGNAGILVTSVIGKAERKNTNWLFLDTGVFQGLMETIGGIKYKIETGKKSGVKKYMLAGPTCDSFDKMFSCYLANNLRVGDKLYILDAGAYTTCYASHFDGFNPPEVHFLKEKRARRDVIFSRSTNCASLD